ncbi:hypothetical protein RGQ15_13385 [Paracoccus sp. MBLB3053]|uniref:30S ribosomal protein S21 n=1 Tax=Paracoccus aurantius TaxID=3073814 RepID=A0ABU2HU30_9RHOB|nr:hypothetical protein [Paracoccus sp. MBLB3053]MDS9468558.1 hypothetical protein [Paracoccus sp. MBLB3053]
MNVNQLMGMLSRMLTNRLMHWGIRKANSDSSGRQTPQQRQREKSARKAIKRARQAARITRRIGR